MVDGNGGQRKMRENHHFVESKEVFFSGEGFLKSKKRWASKKDEEEPFNHHLVETEEVFLSKKAFIKCKKGWASRKFEEEPSKVSFHGNYRSFLLGREGFL